MSIYQANTLESLLEYVTWKWEGIFDKYGRARLLRWQIVTLHCHRKL